MSNLQYKKILVTGGTGFLGQHIVRNLLARGVPQKNIFTPKSEDLDLRKRENCRKAVAGRNVVIHTAGITGNVELHKNHPARIFYDNLMMGVELMEAARVSGVEKFVTIGSATEYPNNARLPYREEDLWIGPVEENHAPYTIAKKMLLVEAQAYRKQYGLNAIHLLLTNMYGPGEHEDGGPIPSMIRRVADAKKNGRNFMEIWGTGKPTRDFLYVEDAAEGIILAAEKYDKEEPVNLGSGYEISIKEVAETIMRVMNFTGQLKFDASKPDGLMRRLLDASRAEREFGFRAMTDFEKGLKKTVTYHGSR